MSLSVRSKSVPSWNATIANYVNYVKWWEYGRHAELEQVKLFYNTQLIKLINIEVICIKADTSFCIFYSKIKAVWFILKVLFDHDCINIKTKEGEEEGDVQSK